MFPRRVWCYQRVAISKLFWYEIHHVYHNDDYLARKSQKTYHSKPTITASEHWSEPQIKRNSDTTEGWRKCWKKVSTSRYDTHHSYYSSYHWDICFVYELNQMLFTPALIPVQWWREAWDCYCYVAALICWGCFKLSRHVPFRKNKKPHLYEFISTWNVLHLVFLVPGVSWTENITPFQTKVTNIKKYIAKRDIYT